MQIGNPADFSLHSGVAARADQRDKFERLARYISRPAVSEKRRSVTNNALVRYRLKTPFRDGTTHVFFEPLDSLARLAALVPKRCVNLTRFDGIFAAKSKLRAQVTPAKRAKGRQRPGIESADETPAEKHAAMTWAKRLKRFFDLDNQTCNACGGVVKIVAAIEDPVAIKKVLSHLDEQGAMPQACHRPAVRGPPGQQAVLHSKG